jgi:hypothetical protein
MNNLKSLLYYDTGNPEVIDAEIILSPFSPESDSQGNNPSPPPLRKGRSPEE